MSQWYLDTSAALKLLIAEVESDALAAAIDEASADLVGCWLLETQLRRAAQREDALSQRRVSDFLDGIDIYAVPSSLFREAGLLPGASLRSLAALHLAAAVRVGVDRVLTYDRRMGQAAEDLGLTVFAPAQRPG